MILAILLAAVPTLVLLAALRRSRTDRVVGWLLPLLLWCLAVIAVLTLVPTSASTGWVADGARYQQCSLDYDGPAPDGFWIFPGGQRLLNTVLFIPAGICLGVLATRWRAWFLGGLLSVLLLAGVSTGVEWLQLEVARLGRSCDVTDIVDNATGGLLGVLLGLVVGGLVRLRSAPRWRRPRHSSVGPRSGT